MRPGSSRLSSCESYLLLLRDPKSRTVRLYFCFFDDRTLWVFSLCLIVKTFYLRLLKSYFLLTINVPLMYSWLQKKKLVQNIISMSDIGLFHGMYHVILHGMVLYRYYSQTSHHSNRTRSHQLLTSHIMITTFSISSRNHTNQKNKDRKPPLFVSYYKAHNSKASPTKTLNTIIIYS